MSSFNTNLPNIRLVQSLIKDKKQVEVKLLTGDLLTGSVRWQDDDCICILDSANEQNILWRQAIAYIKPKA